jgi:hypothetical protein
MSVSGIASSLQYTGTPIRARPVYRLDPARNRKVQQKKEKKMGWVKRKFAQWTREAWEDSCQDETVIVNTTHNGVDAKTSMRFTIYPASGGYVIEHYKQDRYKDNDGPSLTIVNNGESLGTAIEHILAIEALKA